LLSIALTTINMDGVLYVNNSTTYRVNNSVAMFVPATENIFLNKSNIRALYPSAETMLMIIL